MSAVKAVSGGDESDSGASLVSGGNTGSADTAGDPVDFAGGDEKGGSADQPAEGMTTNQEAKLSAGPKAESGDKSDKGAGSVIKDIR